MSEPDSILGRIAAGDPDATRACIVRYGGLVAALVRREGSGSHADAEDLMQEIFIELWKHAARFDPAVATEATFVAMIARRRLIDRRRRRGRCPEDRPLPADLVADTARDGRLAIEQNDDAAAARRALADLRDDQRRVLLLAIDGGLTYDQIARQTGLPLGTVKTHARRGLLRLRERLGVAPAARPIAVARDEEVSP